MRLLIIGSTGSIGQRALAVLKENCGISLAICCMSDVLNLERQIERYHPEYAVVLNEDAYLSLKSKTGLYRDTEIISGKDALLKLIKDCDVILNAASGFGGVEYTLAAIKERKTILLANKESVVACGSVVMKRIKESNIKLIPVDSEHSAIYQILNVYRDRDIKRIVLTASGGPSFRCGKNLTEMTIEEILDHPTWDMGKLITFNSATMVNKAQEVIEAKYLFNIPVTKIEVLVHRQSIVHGMVEFTDGHVISVLYPPDMKRPIALALKEAGIQVKEPSDGSLDILYKNRLDFKRLDREQFPAYFVYLDFALQGDDAPPASVMINERLASMAIGKKIGIDEFLRFLRECFDNYKVEPFDGPDSLSYVREKVERTLKEVVG